MDALNITIEAKNQQIIELKDSVVEAEIKTRKMLDRLNKIQSGEAQASIDSAMEMLGNKMNLDLTR